MKLIFKIIALECIFFLIIFKVMLIVTSFMQLVYYTLNSGG